MSVAPRRLALPYDGRVGEERGQFGCGPREAVQAARRHRACGAKHFLQEDGLLFGPIYRLNCHLQAWILITGWILPSFLVQILLTPFYALDMILYSMDRIGWSENRRQIFGPVFVGLGKVNLAGYDEVAKVISNPQLRGNYLGRTSW